MDLPYEAEYARSGRATCKGCTTKGCKSLIGPGTLRLAVMVQSTMFDEKTAQWYHFECFFKKQRPKTVDDIHNFETLRIEDQQKIRDSIINTGVGVIVLPDKKGKKRDAISAAAKEAALQDFKIECSKSSRTMCRGCEQKIMKGEIQISKKDFETEVGMKNGGRDLWHHLTCFTKLRANFGYFESADKLPGFESLSKEDQTEAKKQIPAIEQEDVPEIKKVKTEDSVDDMSEEDSKLYAEQNKIMYKYRDQLQKNLNKNQLIKLLEENNQEIPPGVDRILDRLADIMTFGALLPCKVCKRGQLVFDKYGYRCKGDLTEWSKCNTLEKAPNRKPFVVRKEFKDNFPFLKKYKYVPRTRVVKDDPNPAGSLKKEEGDEGPKVKRELPALYNMQFVILGRPENGKKELKKLISKLGGKVVTKICSTVMAVIATEEVVKKMGARMKEAQANLIHVVPESFVDEATENAGKIPELVLKKSICDWGSDPNTRLPPEPSTSNRSKPRRAHTSSMPSKVKLKLKGGGAVDPDSGLENVAHVYKDGTEKYTAVLGKTDIQSKKNSYYKMQLLLADNGQRYWVFMSWGRIGTTIGSHKLREYQSLHLAKRIFREVYELKSGNAWNSRHDFVKVPHLFYPIDVDYGEDDAVQKLDITDVESKLPQPVQNLIRLLFDVNSMNKVMLEFELDTEKMPLGKLSKRQILSAYGVLTELQNLVDQGGSEARFIDASNRFYTFIPHSFGMDDPPILRDAEVINQKVDLLDNLMELEIAYNLMKSSGSEHTVDGYYHQLNTEIEVLDRNGEHFKIIEEYVTNTHATTHSSYILEILDAFVVKRQGEDKKFQPFRKLHNRKLLWHGSRTTNFAGILAQGLRIAPPEAPVTGYMFGKGIYFADMVSKSANYCCISPSNSTGLLLLSEVALGNMYERTHADYIEKLPKGKHSTKGIGKTHPDPAGAKFIDDVEVPAGKGVPVTNVDSSLLYNEYIVYDVAQVNTKYLLKVDFKYIY